MTVEELQQQFRAICTEPLPLPGAGATPERLCRLMQVGRRDVSLAKLAEAHWDALAILAEAGRSPAPGAFYAVWASEIPNQAMTLEQQSAGNPLTLSGVKRFCSGAGLVDRALVSVGDGHLVEVDLQTNAERLSIDASDWQTEAFRMTRTSTIVFKGTLLDPDALLAGNGWYTGRSGFWHGACGPAACWAGAAAGLVDFAMGQKRRDEHTLVHLAAMRANVWAMENLLDAAGREIDQMPHHTLRAKQRALMLRHLIEQMCTEILRRFARAYGPHPLAMDAEISRRYQELDLYMRQSHGERDLAELGSLLTTFDDHQTFSPC